MPWKIKNNGFSPYLNILESELRFIAKYPEIAKKVFTVTPLK